MRNRVTESNIFFRSLHLGVEDNGETSVIGNETMRGNDGSRSSKSMAAMFTKEALFFEAEISGAAGNGRQGDEGGRGWRTRREDRKKEGHKKASRKRQGSQHHESTEKRHNLQRNEDEGLLN